MSEPLASRAWLRKWIADAAGRPQDSFDDSTPLFADGLLDSTDFVELILVLQETTGCCVDVALLRPDAFRSIDTISRHFLGETSDVAERNG